MREQLYGYEGEEIIVSDVEADLRDSKSWRLVLPNVAKIVSTAQKKLQVVANEPHMAEKFERKANKIGPINVLVSIV